MSAGRENASSLLGITLHPRRHPDEVTVQEEELIMHLERDQLVAETFRPVAQAPLSGRVLLGLWALRIFVVVVSLMVVYTFIARLG